MKTVQNCHDQVRGVEAVCLRTGCKINLCLHITGVSETPPHVGWHHLDTVFAPLPEPFDTLHITPGESAGLRVRCATPGIDPANNTLTKAWGAFAAATGFAPSLDVELVKGIPHGAGLGGGSADAAALLVWLNSVAPQPLSREALMAVGLAVGADVPFFVRGVPCRGTGFGERLEPVELTPVAGLHLVLVCPAEQVSTPWAYRAYDEAVAAEKRKFGKNSSKGLTGGGQFAISTFACLWSQSARLVNDFEKVVFAQHPVLARHKAFLLQAGALAAVMSGSGSSLFGLFRHDNQAAAAAVQLRESGVATYRHSFTTAR